MVHHRWPASLPTTLSSSGYTWACTSSRASVVPSATANTTASTGGPGMPARCPAAAARRARAPSNPSPNANPNPSPNPYPKPNPHPNPRRPDPNPKQASESESAFRTVNHSLVDGSLQVKPTGPLHTLHAHTLHAHTLHAHTLHARCTHTRCTARCTAHNTRAARTAHVCMCRCSPTSWCSGILHGVHPS